MKLSKIIWLSLAILVLVIFFVVIPIDEYDRHVILYGFACSILFFGCIFFLLADFKSLEELTEQKRVFEDHTVPTRKFAPFVIIPALILPFVLIFVQSSRVERELKNYGVMTKGKVTGGESTTTSRRGRSSTSYDIVFTYTDSANQTHRVEDGVNGDEFDKLYEGAEIDIVYSRLHPGLAEAVLSLKDIQKYKNIAVSDVGIEHLIPLLEGTVAGDSIVTYLNTVCYEWQPGDDNSFVNSYKDVAVKLAADHSQVIYIKQTMAYAYDPDKPFEKSLEKYGFKKKSTTNDEGETREVYYTDKYTLFKDRQTGESRNSSDFLAQPAFDIWYLARLE